MTVKWQDYWKVLWKVLPDDERQQWTLDPFMSVGPLRFGASPDEVSQALSTVTDDSQVDPRRGGAREPAPIVTEGQYQEFGLHLYYRHERLAGVVVNARLGPQVTVGGVALTGQVPSVLEQWLLGRAEARRDGSECVMMGPGIPGSDRLGVWIDVQRAGDRLLTRPVIVSWETMDNLPDFLPGHAWSACDGYHRT